MELSCSIREGFATLVTNQFESLAAKVGETATTGLEAVATFWVRIDSPTLATQQGSDWTLNGPVQTLHDNVLWVTGTIFCIAVLITGVRLAWEQRAEPLRQLLKATLTLVLVTGAGAAFLQLLISVSDWFAQDVMDRTLEPGQTFDKAVGALVLAGAGSAPVNAMPLIAMMFVGVAVFMASVVQVVLLLIRSAMLVLLAGTFPLAAAATNTEVGRAWFRKYCAWALAFIAYKPAAALVYAAALELGDAGVNPGPGNRLVSALTGLMMMLLALFALPALLRFAVPVTSAVAGGAAGSGAGLADPGGFASGAISTGRSVFGSASAGRAGGGGGGGGGGATGAVTAGSAAAGAVTAGSAAAGAALNATKKAGGALAGAAAHSAGEPGGGGSSSTGGGSQGWTSRRPPRTTKTAAQPTEQPTGPTGSR
ncbi:hypothetical protein [Kribbella flavida]|nr:hypothetical protein [Kribbella flavida]